MPRLNEDDPAVIKRVAISLLPRREEGISVAELTELAQKEGIWAYQIMDALCLRNDGDLCVPRQDKSFHPARLTEDPKEVSIWEVRLRGLLPSLGKGMGVEIPLAMMLAQAWPPSAWERSAFWREDREAGRAARALGWEPVFREGKGILLRKLRVEPWIDEAVEADGAFDDSIHDEHGY